MLAVSVIAVIILPLYVYLELSPSFVNLTIENTEREAVHIAAHIASSVIRADRDVLKASDVTAEMVNELETVIQDLGMVKLKLFSPDGEIIYSSDRAEIGEVNNKDYFYTIVAQGRTYSMLVKKDNRTLEDQIMTSDVIETYVPVMRNGKFIGAIETYYDVTENMEKLTGLVVRSSLTVGLIAAGLLLAVVVVYLRGKSSMKKSQQMEEALQQSERKYRDLYDNAPDMYYSLDREGVITDCNEPTLFMLGYPREKIVGRSVREFFTERSRQLFDQFFPQILGQKGDYLLEREFVRRDGSVFPAGLHVFSIFDKKGNFFAIRTIARDITSEKIAQDKLRELAERDPLTGLFNRRMFFIFLDAEVGRASRHNKNFALIMLDIDHFKRINDSFGHDVGDEVLRVVSSVILDIIRKTDILSRYGGEEFLLLLPETDSDGSMVLAEKIRSMVEGIRHEKADRPVTISLGVTLFRRGDTLESILKRADDALYQAKHGGRNRSELLL